MFGFLVFAGANESTNRQNEASIMGDRLLEAWVARFPPCGSELGIGNPFVCPAAFAVVAGRGGVASWPVDAAIRSQRSRNQNVRTRGSPLKLQRDGDDRFTDNLVVSRKVKIHGVWFGPGWHGRASP